MFPLQLQEQLLDCQDRVAELEELCEKQQDEVASLKAQLVSWGASDTKCDIPNTAMQALQARNEELERVSLGLVKVVASFIADIGANQAMPRVSHHPCERRSSNSIKK